MLLKYTRFCYYGRYFARCTRMFHLVAKIIPHLPLSSVPLCQFIYHEENIVTRYIFTVKTRLRDSIKLLIFHFASKLLYLHMYIRERLVYVINSNGSEIFTLLLFFFFKVSYILGKMEFLNSYLHTHFSLYIWNFYFFKNAFHLFAR